MIALALLLMLAGLSVANPAGLILCALGVCLVLVAAVRLRAAADYVERHG